MRRQCISKECRHLRGSHFAGTLSITIAGGLDFNIHPDAIVAAEVQCLIKRTDTLTSKLRTVPATGIELLQLRQTVLSYFAHTWQSPTKLRVMHQNGLFIGTEHDVEFDRTKSIFHTATKCRQRIFRRQCATSAMSSNFRIGPHALILVPILLATFY